MKPGPLRRLLSGEKRIESRFSKVRCLPHGWVKPGDRIFFKRSGGPILACATVEAACTWELRGPEEVAALRDLYNRWIRADSAYWEEKQNAKWVTLIGLRDVRLLPALPFLKRDRQPWTILDRSPVDE
jgi:hypothetical protein